MVTTPGDNPTLEVVVQRMDELQKVIDRLQASNKQADHLDKTFRKLKASVRSFNQELKQLQTAGISPQNLNKNLRHIATGGYETAFSLAQHKGLRNQLKAEAGNLATDVVRTYASEIRKKSKLGQDLALTGLFQTRQTNPARDLDTLKQQITAQTARLNDAQLLAQRVSQVGRVPFPEHFSPTDGRVKYANQERVNALLQQELQAHDRLERKKQALLRLDRMRARTLKNTTQEAVKSNQAFQKLVMPDGEISPAQGIKNRLADPEYIPQLFRLQAALLGNYVVMGQFFQLFSFGSQFVLEFDKALHDLAAVTNTTDIEMKGLSQRLIDVSRQTKFTAVEVAQAATIMGQAGFSAKQIAEGIESVTLLATAVGTDLPKAMDTVTSVVSVFNLQMSEVSHVSDVLTGAVNRTKLTIDKLQLGLQYAGNAAAQSGATFEELVAALGAMANAGIRSGSTMGTGLRQAMVSLQSPTEKLRKELQSVGLSVEDVNIGTQGLVGVFSNLHKAGFGAENAFKSLEVRAAAAVLAFSNNIETARMLEKQLILTKAAAEANVKQMRSLANIVANFKSQLGTAIMSGFQPLLIVLKDLIRATGTLIDLLNDLRVVLPVISTAIAGFGLAAGVKQLAKLLPVLSSIPKSLGAISFASLGASKSMKSLNKASLAGRASIGMLGLKLTALIGVYSAFRATIGSSTGELDKNQAAVDRSVGEIEKTSGSLESLDQSLGRINERYAMLSENSGEALRVEILRVREEFLRMGKTLDTDTVNSVDTLIEAIQGLKSELQDGLIANLRLAVLETSKLIQEQARLASMGGGLWDRVTNRYVDNASSFLEAFGSASALDAAKGVLFLGSERTRATHRETYNIRDRSVEAVYGPGGLSDEVRALSTVNVSEMTKEEREQYQKQVEGLVEDYGTILSGMAKEILRVRSSTEGDSFTREQAAQQLGRAYDRLSAKRSELTSLQANLIELEMKTMSLASESIQGTDFFKTQQSKIDQLNRDMILLTDEIGKAEKAGDDKLRAQLVGKVRDKSRELSELISVFSGEKVDKEFEAQLEGLRKTLGEELFESGKSQALSELMVTASEVKAERENRLKIQTEAVIQDSKELTEKFEEFMTGLDLEIKRATAGMDRNLARLSTQISGAEDKESPLYGQYSVADINNMKKAREKVETARMEAELGVIRAQRSAVTSEIGQRLDYAKKASGSGQLAEEVEQLARVNSLKVQQLDLQKRETEILEELKARRGEATESTMNFEENFRAGLKSWGEEQQRAANWRLTIHDDVIDVLDTTKTSFKDMVTELVTGTASIGDAWRGFMTKVLESILDKTTSNMASSFGYFLVSGVQTAADSLLGAGAGAAPTGKNEGGLIRAEAGRFISTRDSVPVLTRPGEYVLRKSAVDSIGRQNLDMMNAYGNRMVSQAGPKNTLASQGERSGQTVNVWVVKEGEQPSMGKNDVLAIVSQDILTGGQTKKLIKSINTGKL